MRKAVFVLGLSTIVFASATAYLWSQLRDARDELERRPRAVIPRQFPTSRMESASIGRDKAPAPVSAEPAKPQSEAPAPSASAELDAAMMAFQRSWVGERREKLADPRYRAVLLAHTKLGLRSSIPDVHDWVDLPPNLLDRLIDLLAEQSLESQEEMPDPSSEDTVEPSEWARRQEELQQRQQEAIEQLLGPDRKRQWDEYQNSTSARMQVRMLRGSLSEVNALREDQVRPLVDVLSSHDRRMAAEMQDAVAASGGGFAREEQIERMSRKNKSIHQEAAKILSPAQLESLDVMLDRPLQNMRAEARLEAIGELTQVP